MIDYDWLNGVGSGAIKTFGDPKKPQLLERLKSNPPPCGSCPKKGPQHEHEFTLSTANMETLAFYRETKATFGRGLSEEEARDAVVRRNFLILDQMFAGAEQGDLGETVANAVAMVISRK